MLNDIQRHEYDNVGGNFSFEFIPHTDVDTIPATYKGAIHTEIILLSGKRWYQGYATEETMKFTDQQVESENGAFHKKSFEGIIPKNRQEIIDTLESMKNLRFIVKVKDNNGTIVIAGTKEEPLKFKSSLDTKSNVSGRNEYKFEFSGDCVNKSPVYNVTCPLSL